MPIRHKSLYLIVLSVAVLCSSCSFSNDKKKEPLIHVKKYNYNTNERVHLRVKGFENCKFEINPDELMFEKKFILPNKYIKKPIRKDNEEENNKNDLFRL